MSNIRETYTKEYRHRYYDDPKSYVDRQLEQGKSRIISSSHGGRSSPIVIVERRSYDAPTNPQHDLRQLVADEVRRQTKPETVERLVDIHQIVSSEVEKHKPKPLLPNTIKVVIEKDDKGVSELRELRNAVEELQRLIIAKKESKDKGAKEKKDEEERARDEEEKRQKEEEKKKREEERRLRELEQEEKELKLQQDITRVMESQLLIQRQLDVQSDLLNKSDNARITSDTLLRNDVTEALTEHKQLTDKAIADLTRRVTEISRASEDLRHKIDCLNQNLEILYETDSDEVDVTRNVLKSSKVPNKKRSSSESSGSVSAVLLQPAAELDGRRPSQAFVMKNKAVTDHYAEEEAKKAVADATQISAKEAEKSEKSTIPQAPPPPPPKL